MADSTGSFHREYQYRLPLPLAQLYSRAYNAKDARGRHDNSFYLFEALVKLATAPLVGCYLAEAEAGAARLQSLDRLLVQLALPSLGQWVGILRECARHFSHRADAGDHPLGQLWGQLSRSRKDLPHLLALYQRIKNGPDGAPGADQSCSIIQVLDALVNYRNAVFGHGGGRIESFYDADMGPLLFPAADELLGEGVLDMLGPRGSRLVHLTDLRVLGEQQIEVSMRELVGLRGERSAPLILARQEADKLSPNVTALLWPGHKLPLRLDPLLIYRESEVTDEVLFLNRDRNGRQVEYLSYTTGRTERTAATLPAMAALLSRITGSPVDEKMLTALAEHSLSQTVSVEALLPAVSPAVRVLGDYELLAEIGRGGMGVVYLARQLSLGRLVALKMLPADLAGNQIALARFRHEMRALARCDHRNIVKVLSSGAMPEPDGRLYYAMEYVPGCDLEQVWRELAGDDAKTAPIAGTSTLDDTAFAQAVHSASRRKREQTQKSRAGPFRAEADPDVPLLPLPALPEVPCAKTDRGGYIRRIASLIRDAAQALQAVHEQQVVHRDVKPANLMLSADGARVVLMDFGLAKGQSLELTASGAGGLLGTLRYAAPEQLAAASLRVGPAADVRGLGVVLWELLTRKRLFADAEDEKQLAMKVHEQDVPKLRKVDPSFDADLEAIVARATERRVTDRIAAAGQLAEYLQLYLDGKPLPIRPPTVREIAFRWIRERRGLVASVVAAAIAAIAVAMAVNVGLRKPELRKFDPPRKAETLLEKNVAYASRCGVTERWTGMKPEEVATLEDPDFDDFVVQLDSKMFDLSSWHPADPQTPELAYLTRVLDLVREPGRSKNGVVRLQFRTEGDNNLPRVRDVTLDDRSVLSQLTVRAFHAAGKPMKDGRRVSLYELRVDVSRLPEGKTFRVIADSIFVNGFQSDPEWAGSRLDALTQRVQLAIKLPESKTFSGYNLYEYPVNQKDAKKVSRVGEFWPDPSGGAFAWTIHSPKKGYVYEINWTWAEK